MIDEKKLLDDLMYCKGLGRKSLEAVIEIIKEQPQVVCKDCTRREWYQKGYRDGVNADKWIPCSERLPNRAFVTVWLCFTNEYTSYIKKAVWHGENFYWKNGKKVKDKPIAWMEYIVPQPYKKEGAE